MSRALTLAYQEIHKVKIDSHLASVVDLLCF